MKSNELASKSRSWKKITKYYQRKQMEGTNRVKKCIFAKWKTKKW